MVGVLPVLLFLHPSPPPLAQAKQTKESAQLRQRMRGEQRKQYSPGGPRKRRKQSQSCRAIVHQCAGTVPSLPPLLPSACGASNAVKASAGSRPRSPFIFFHPTFPSCPSPPSSSCLLVLSVASALFVCFPLQPALLCLRFRDMQAHYASQWSAAVALCARSRPCCSPGAMAALCAIEYCDKPCASPRSRFCLDCRILCRQSAGKIGG